MSTPWIIRPYAPGDRTALRRICCDTADGGRPIEGFFEDRELAADLLMNYYTDFEPESAWVAEEGGDVVGYLTGCRDTRRFRRAMIWRIAPKALCASFRRGTWWAPSMRRLLRWNLMSGRRIAGCPKSLRPRYPAHLHINLRPGMGGRGIGRQLMERFLSHMRSAGIPGVHLSVREDNMAAIAFFEKMGFARFARRPWLQLGPGSEAMRYSVILVKLLK